MANWKNAVVAARRGGLSTSKMGKPTLDEEIFVSGLSLPASIIVDRWGIPHVRAESFMDMFFVQGFNAARDRLWQLDIWRKRGLGLLAADFGPGYLEQDRAARLFLYRGDMTAEWQSYSEDAETICSRFTAGINAYVQLCEAEPERLPPEFALLGISPARWAPEDVVRIRSHALMRNALSEVIRSNVLAECDPKIDDLRQRLKPPHDALAEHKGRPEPLPLDCLDVFRLASAPVTFEKERLQATLEEASLWRAVPPLGQVVNAAVAEGSNNWVVHGSRTDSGRPILASDPHRAHSVPSLRYIVHIASPDFDGIGAGEPFLPGISIGHNGQSAFGLTLFYGHDQEDVYTYETHPEDPDLYRYREGWERIQTFEEEASLKRGGTAHHILRFTRHGPVIAEYRDRRLIVALRTLWTEPGTTPYFGSISSMRAKSFPTFRTAMERWGVPAVNQVYADTGGDVGWVVAGFSPIRANWDGLLPVAGNGHYEWEGFLPGDELPAAHNPEKGYFATANEYNLPDNWAPEMQIGYEWLDSSRAERLEEMLRDDKNHSVATSKDMQTDVLSIPARRIVRLLAGVCGRNAEDVAALDMLRKWDCRLTADSASAALFEVWWSQHLRPALLCQRVDNPAILALIAPGDIESVIEHLEVASEDNHEAFEELVLQTLGTASAACAERMGPEPTAWSWGELHQAVFRHPVGVIRPQGLPNLDVGPVPFYGSESTPMMGAYRGEDFELTAGASFRLIVDVGAWDNSVCINTPGQSGDPRSPYYRDMVPIWARGEYVPLLYSEQAIEQAEAFRIRLVPRAGAENPS